MLTVREQGRKGNNRWKVVLILVDKLRFNKDILVMNWFIFKDAVIYTYNYFKMHLYLYIMKVYIIVMLFL